MTIAWFVIWLAFDLVGDREPLTFSPVNWWAGSLLAAAALDLAGGSARRAGSGRSRHARRGPSPRTATDDA